MARDYVGADLPAPPLDRLFPNMAEFDRSVTTWPWLRRTIDHPYRADKRNPIVGFINRDEASILHASARLFAGKAGLEIGAWRGWSTAHLIAAGLDPLTVVEPLLRDREWRAEFEAVVDGAGGSASTRLVPEGSPDAVKRLGEAGARWSFVFIDGDHDGEAPANDARAALPYLAPTAMVLFHDLVSPHVARGLRVFEEAGFRVMAYQTAQMMGVAWRGDVMAVAHTPDPEQTWSVPEHLAGLKVSGGA